MSRLTERVENFHKAFNLLKKVHSNYIVDQDNDVLQMALVQSFEVVYELGWKCLKDYLSDKEIKTFTPKDTIKAAFKAEILPNAQIWIDMAKDRNFSSHEYNQDKVLKIIEKIGSSYFYELQNFNDWLGGMDV